MNNELLKNNYLVIPNFIDQKKAEKVLKEFYITDEIFEFGGDPQAPNSSAVYNYLPALELLTNKTSHISEIIGETVLPTYVYSRIYRNGSVLTKHTDRPSCEISVTLHLGGDKPWAIWIEKPNKEKKCVNLNPGDAMIYLGCIAPHWRDKFEGEDYVQFFLHYVRSRGCYGSHYFDNGDKNNDVEIDQLLEEYENMGFEHVSKKAILPRKYRKKESEKISIVSEENDDTQYVDFDDVIIVNDKYKQFLKKETTSEPVIKTKQNKESNKLSSKSLSDFVLHIEEFIDPDFCDTLLSEYAPTNYWEHTLTGSGHDPQARKCNYIPISDQGIIEEENQQSRKEIDEYLFNVVKDIIANYQDQHPEFELEIQEDSGYELLKYEVGDFYIQHSDSFKEQPRALTVIMSMNDAYEGGEVALFNRELVYKLDAGDVLVFPSNFMYPHEIMPITRGTRYSIITWVV